MPLVPGGLTFNIGRRWKDQKALAVRLANLVRGFTTDHVPFVRDANSNESFWQLDTGNTWWMSVQGEQITLTCHYRKTEEFWAAMEVVLTDLLNLKE